MFDGHNGESKITIVNDRTQEWDELSVYGLFEEFVMHKDLFKKRKVTLDELRGYSWCIDDATEGFMGYFKPFFILMGDWRIACVFCGKHNLYLPSNMDEHSHFYDKVMTNRDAYDGYVLACMLEDIVSYLDIRDEA